MTSLIFASLRMLCANEKEEGVVGLIMNNVSVAMNSTN